jgi:hypothetical protein
MLMVDFNLAKKLRKKDTPLKIINELPKLSNIPVIIAIQESARIVPPRSAATSAELGTIPARAGAKGGQFLGHLIGTIAVHALGGNDFRVILLFRHIPHEKRPSGGQQYCIRVIREIASQ